MSQPAKDDALEKLLHDVNSKCASLRSAVALLRTASAEESRQLLGLMVQQGRSLADTLCAYQAGGGRP